MFGFGNMLKDYLEFNGITQGDFASRIGITTKHMNEILNEKTNISEDLMIAISLVTDIDIKLILLVETKKRIYEELNSKFQSEEEIKTFINSFHIKEMERKNWITLNDKESYLQNAYDLLKFLNAKNFDIFNKYSNEKILYKKSDDSDLKKVYLWLARCDSLVKSQKVGTYNSSNLPILLKKIEDERINNFNKEKLIDLFNEYGIYLVIENALDGTKVRGATKVIGNNPAIYMTTYLKEKSSFYFALYHELGHVKSNYNKAKSKVLIDGDSSDEKKADLFSLEQMIPEDLYKIILNDFNSIETICKDNKIPKTFVYSRLAEEGIIEYNDINNIKSREKIEY